MCSSKKNQFDFVIQHYKDYANDLLDIVLELIQIDIDHYVEMEEKSTIGVAYRWKIEAANEIYKSVKKLKKTGG